MTDPKVSQLGKSKSTFKVTPPLALYLKVMLIQISWIGTRRPSFLLKSFLDYFKNRQVNPEPQKMMCVLQSRGNGRDSVLCI